MPFINIVLASLYQAKMKKGKLIFASYAIVNFFVVCLWLTGILAHIQGFQKWLYSDISNNHASTAIHFHTPFLETCMLIIKNF